MACGQRRAHAGLARMVARSGHLCGYRVGGISRRIRNQARRSRASIKSTARSYSRRERRRDGGDLVTAGGRVLGVTATGATLAGSIDAAYDAVGKIHFAGMQYRKDIGSKGLATLQ